MGLRADIFRSDIGDCSNRGVSFRFRRVTIVEVNGKPMDGPFEPAADAPAVGLFSRVFEGETSWRVEVLNVPGRPMAGGTFIFSTDSRFREISDGPVSFHDRYER